MKLGIFGFGYVAQFLAHAHKQQFEHIYATSRQPSIRSLSDQKKLTLFDFNEDAVHHIFSHCDCILNCIPPSRQGCDPVLEWLDSARLKQSHNQVRWIGYLSSTAVYGDHQGAWVTENTPVKPNAFQGKNRVRAESEWMKLYENYGLPVHLFRVAGIYGPKRNALEKIRAGKPSIYKENQFFSRIHVADICQFLCASMSCPTAGEVFNLSDDLPAPSHMVDAFAAALIGAPPPKCIPFEGADLSEMGRQFYLSNKRVSNQKIKKVLSRQLIFPTYREGLAHILNTE